MYGDNDNIYILENQKKKHKCWHALIDWSEMHTYTDTQTHTQCVCHAKTTSYIPFIRFLNSVQRHTEREREGESKHGQKSTNRIRRMARCLLVAFIFNVIDIFIVHTHRHHHYHYCYYSHRVRFTFLLAYVLANVTLYSTG